MGAGVSGTTTSDHPKLTDLPEITSSAIRFSSVGFARQGNNCWCNSLLKLVLESYPEIFLRVARHYANDSSLNEQERQLKRKHGGTLWNVYTIYQLCSKDNESVPSSVSQEVREAFSYLFKPPTGRGISPSSSVQEDVNEAFNCLIAHYQSIVESDVLIERVFNSPVYLNVFLSVARYYASKNSDEDKQRGEILLTAYKTYLQEIHDKEESGKKSLGDKPSFKFAEEALSAFKCLFNGEEIDESSSCVDLQKDPAFITNYQYISALNTNLKLEGHTYINMTRHYQPKMERLERTPEHLIWFELPEGKDHCSFSALFSDYFKSKVSEPYSLSVGSKEYTCIEETRQFETVPKQLLIGLKRFDNNSSKINSPVDMPLDLYLSPEMTKENEEVHYCLAKVIVHIGSTLGSGHYVYYEKKPTKNQAGEDEWLKFNDAQVTTISSEEMTDILQGKKDRSETSYMHLYERQGYEKIGKESIR
jgi:hypothetical protein